MKEARKNLPNIMGQSQRFYQVNVQPELQSNRAGDLRNFDRVGQAVAKMIRIAACKNLRLVVESAEGTSVDDAVAVTLKIIAVGMAGLGKTAPARFFHAYRVGGEREDSLAARKGQVRFFATFDTARGRPVLGRRRALSKAPSLVSVPCAQKISFTPNCS